MICLYAFITEPQSCQVDSLTDSKRLFFMVDSLGSVEYAMQVKQSFDLISQMYATQLLKF